MERTSAPLPIQLLPLKIRHPIRMTEPAKNSLYEQGPIIMHSKLRIAIQILNKMKELAKVVFARALF
jgi:hypothetical protein